MVKTLKEYLAEVEGTSGRLNEVKIFYHFDSKDVIARFILASMLKEDRKYVDLGKGREIFFHTAHITAGQDHLHFYQKSSKLYALNRDGSAHDKSHGIKMARWAREGVKDHYPDFTLPKDGLIEAMMDEPGSSFLMESFGSSNPVLVPESTQLLAETRASP